MIRGTVKMTLSLKKGKVVYFQKENDSVTETPSGFVLLQGLKPQIPRPRSDYLADMTLQTVTWED